MLLNVPFVPETESTCLAALTYVPYDDSVSKKITTYLNLILLHVLIHPNEFPETERLVTFLARGSVAFKSAKFLSDNFPIPSLNSKLTFDLTALSVLGAFKCDCREFCYIEERFCSCLGWNTMLDDLISTLYWDFLGFASEMKTLPLLAMLRWLLIGVRLSEGIILTLQWLIFFLV